MKERERWRTVEPILACSYNEKNRTHIINIPGNVFVMVSRLRLPLPFCHVTHILHIFICRFSSGFCCCCRSWFGVFFSLFLLLFWLFICIQFAAAKENVRCWEITLYFINSNRKTQFKIVYYYEWLTLDCFNLSIWYGIWIATIPLATDIFVDVESNVLDIKLKLTIDNFECVMFDWH